LLKKQTWMWPSSEAKVLASECQKQRGSHIRHQEWNITRTARSSATRSENYMASHLSMSKAASRQQWNHDGAEAR
jgi:hypothetical protein